MISSVHKPSHLKALLRKNWIIWKRGWCVSILEIVVPLLFAAIMLVFRKVAPTEAISQTTYYTNPFIYDGTLTSADLSFFKDCNAAENGGIVGLAPQGDSLITDLKSILGKKYFISTSLCI